MSHRRQGAGTADLNSDVFENGLGLPRRVLERDRPAWRLRCPAQFLLLLDRIDFRHNAVSLIRQCFPFCIPLPDEIEQVIDITAAGTEPIYFETGLRKRF